MDSIWKKQYQEKLTTADQAVASVQSGDAIVYCPFFTTTPDLDKALAKRAPELHDVRLEYTALTYIPETMKVDHNDEQHRPVPSDGGCRGTVWSENRCAVRSTAPEY